MKYSFNCGKIEGMRQPMGVEWPAVTQRSAKGVSTGEVVVNGGNGSRHNGCWIHCEVEVE